MTTQNRQSNALTSESDIDQPNAVYLSAEAVLEIDELESGIRSDVPSFGALLHTLRTPEPSPSFQGNNSVSMLADARSYTVLRDALAAARRSHKQGSPDFHETVMKFLDDLEAGVASHDKAKLESAKRFCLVLGESLIKRQMTDAYEKRERSDSRYISHDALS